MHKYLARIFYALILFVLIWTAYAFVLPLLWRGPSQVLNPKPVPAFEIPAPMPDESYAYFIAMGDQGTGKHGQRRVAELMNQKARQDGLHFVLLVGDNFYPDGVASTTDAQWQEKFVGMYDLPHLHVPFYAALGNHDHRQNRAAFQVAYARQNPKWVMPANYYSFSHRMDSSHSVQFWALDTEHIIDGSKFDPEQIAWLARELQRSTATWKVVYGHHPIFSYGEHGHGKRMIRLVRPLLEKYAADLYLSGHDHDRQLLQPIGGVHYIVTGTGAQSRDTAYGPITTFAATNLGFTWFRVSPEAFHVQFLDGEGRVEFAHTWARGTIAKQPYDPSRVIDESVRPKDR